jgi:hypothetical protein
VHLGVVAAVLRLTECRMLCNCNYRSGCCRRGRMGGVGAVGEGGWVEGVLCESTAELLFLKL